MSEESTAGASYLASLKKPITASAATAGPAKERGAVAEGAAKSIPAEQRRSPRYRCQGSAHLREISTGISTWATFTDISLHGIYVEAMSTYRVGARLALTLEVNGLRAELSAEVRVVYPSLGMGVSFLIMSDENRARLVELLASLSLPSAILRPRASANPGPVSSPNAASEPNDPRAALQAITDFFEQRHILSRDEFLRILRRSQAAGK
jgi:hypothetical protein